MRKNFSLLHLILTSLNHAILYPKNFLIKKIFKYTFLILLIFEPNIFGQVQQQWKASLNNNYGSIFLASDIAGNIFVTGNLASMDSPEYTTFEKLSPNGAIIYGTVLDTPCLPAGVYMDGLYNQYVAGAYSGDWAPARFTVAKISSAGILIWQKHDSFSAYDNMVGITGDKSGNSFILKYKNGQNYIIKYDSAGNVQSSIIVIDSINGEGIVLDNQGNILIAGFSYINSICNAIIIKYSPSLVKLWKANYVRTGATITSDFCKIKIASSQNIYYLIDSYTSVNHYAYTLIKYNSAGAQQWVGFYDTSLSGIPSDMVLDSLENIYMTGSAGTIKVNFSGAQLWSDTCPNGVSLTLDKYLNVYSIGNIINTAIRTIKISSAGLRLWSINYSNSPCLEFGSEIITDTARNVIITGGEEAPMLYNEGIIIKYNQTVGIEKISNTSPIKYVLYQNYPNPFNPSTKIKFSLPNPSKGGAMKVTLKIFDVLGREVASLIPPLWGGQPATPQAWEGLQPGTYETEWNASNYPSGVYFYKLTTADYSESKKMILLK